MNVSVVVSASFTDVDPPVSVTVKPQGSIVVAVTV